jgi:hypothetical protein
VLTEPELELESSLAILLIATANGAKRNNDYGASSAKNHDQNSIVFPGRGVILIIVSIEVNFGVNFRLRVVCRRGPIYLVESLLDL